VHFLSLLFFAIASSTHAEPLRDAIASGELMKVKRALDGGADPNSSGPLTPLYLAARRGHGELVTVLLDQGADVNAVTRAGTALQIAARGNHVPVVETLLARGADPNIAGGENMNTPLHDAAERGSVAAARLLLEQGADVNRRNDARHPAIHLAAVKGHDAMVSMLRDAQPVTLNCGWHHRRLQDVDKGSRVCETDQQPEGCAMSVRSIFSFQPATTPVGSATKRFSSS
jgi:ankyrin repeat protein